uniref:Uncharacterized protein n=1 Tax=Steinernema glaseri TaxID=37863 RepID=A0A1I7Z0F1_9BILA
MSEFDRYGLLNCSDCADPDSLQPTFFFPSSEENRSTTLKDSLKRYVRLEKLHLRLSQEKEARWLCILQLLPSPPGNHQAAEPRRLLRGGVQGGRRHVDLARCIDEEGHSNTVTRANRPSLQMYKLSTDKKKMDFMKQVALSKAMGMSRTQDQEAQGNRPLSDISNRASKDSETDSDENGCRE